MKISKTKRTTQIFIFTVIAVIATAFAFLIRAGDQGTPVFPAPAIHAPTTSPSGLAQGQQPASSSALVNGQQ